MYYNLYLKKFKSILSTHWNPPESITLQANELLKYASENNYSVIENFEHAIFESINYKLELWKPYFKIVLDVAFKEGIKLNYILKNNIQKCITSMDRKRFEELLIENKINNGKLLKSFTVIDKDIVIKSVENLINNDDKYNEVLISIFSRGFYNLFTKECTNKFFSKNNNITNDYIKNLDLMYNRFEKNDCSLAFIEIDKLKFNSSFEDGCSYYFNLIKYYYKNLMNHSDLIFIIPSFKKSDVDYQWMIYSKLIIFAEKFKLHALNNAYFRKDSIIKSTTEFIENLDIEKADFSLAAEGFVFKDCFVLNHSDCKEYDLMIVLEKNEKDERKILCPECFSSNVQGNSYPILNVRSWECKNDLCPDRSKYNRGKRFSYVSYIRQNAMLDINNEIPANSVSKWHIDCLIVDDFLDIFDMACRHYSIADKTVDVISNSLKLNEHSFLKRKINRIKDDIKYDKSLFTDYENSPYFKRYMYDKKHIEKYSFEKTETAPGHFLYNGDSYEVLNLIGDKTISAAITSPPYYNAKSYSQWNNIYCYLYNMRNIAKEVFRVLEDGGVYLFNIFDYFDNENNIALSDMGNKRMILGAYIIDCFTKLGFNIVGNIIWNKGEIQGNRSFNQGNYGPYYQAPLNCWEHIFIFSKGKPKSKYKSLNSETKNIRPFIKYVKGKNTLGHDAPFPTDLPDILLSCMDKNDIVLDPFSGSYTTGIAAYKKNIPSICIELSNEYYKLGMNRMHGIINEKD